LENRSQIFGRFGNRDFSTLAKRLNTNEGKKRRPRKDITPTLRDPWRMTADDWAMIEQWAAEGRKRIAPDPSMAELQERARARLERKAERDSAKRRAKKEAERLRRWQASPRGKAAARGATYLQLVAAAMTPGQWFTVAEIAKDCPELSINGIKYTLVQKGREKGLIERAENAACGFAGGYFPNAVRWGRAQPRFLYRLTPQGEAFRAAFLESKGKGPAKD
jgi:hypothetical protein